ncbi:lactate racemase domain-containing protein [Enterovibrio sp. 27052020O]|uniref:lactate racemase domain-containing protein n=1 Tax=Enterovibrio sp. 27052020O TaxID=3241166 RepID=UPI00388CF544
MRNKLFEGGVSFVLDGGFHCGLPKMVKVQQSFKRQKLDDIPAKMREELENLSDGSSLKGQRLAITVGSRGISGLIPVLQETIAYLHAQEAEPFIVPSMGSHGSANAEGQVAILASYGITEASMKVPIRSSMDVVHVATMPDGIPLYLDKIAMEADGIILCNKIKPHADFKGGVESGLLKMLCIGLGNHLGASSLHRYGFHQFHWVIPEAGERLLQKVNIPFAIGLIENAYDELMDIVAVEQAHILDAEPRYLAQAKQNIAQILFPDIDVLIIQEIGKNISGEGMDPNVTGRPGSGVAGFHGPSIRSTVVLALTKATHGNGVGIGMADVTTLGLVQSLDLSAMYTNAATAGTLATAKIPMVMNTDREAIVFALKTAPIHDIQTAKIVWIKNTLELDTIMVSTSLANEIDDISAAKCVSDPLEFRFDAQGKLMPW